MHFDYVHIEEPGNDYLWGGQVGKVLELHVPAQYLKRRLNFGLRYTVPTAITGKFISNLVFRHNGEIICRWPYNLAFDFVGPLFAMDCNTAGTANYGPDWMVLRDGNAVERSFPPQHAYLACDQITWEVIENTAYNVGGDWWFLLACASFPPEHKLTTPAVL